MSTAPKPTILPSATVLLLRDGAEGLEVFMVVRHHEIDSFAGALVFPGGKLDPGDGDPALRGLCRGADALDDAALAFRVAAIREAFEECGVLLAGPRDGPDLVDAARLAALEARYRGPLLRDEIAMAELCRREALSLAVDRLAHFAHWVTPRIMPKIFDTHFFLALAPSDHVALHDGAESLESVWIAPKRALAEADAGRRAVVFPTRMNLAKLARWKSAAEAIRAAQASTVVTVQPEVTPHPEGRLLRIPAAADYGATEVLVGPDGRGARIIA